MSAPTTPADDAVGPAWVRAWDASEGAERATAAFRARFDAEPDGVWSAPGRVNLIGEHTDYNGGLCLPINLLHRTYVAARATSETLSDAVVNLASAQEAAAGLWSARLTEVSPGTVSGWPAYAAGVAWALARAGHAVGGVDAVVDSCVPYGSGLSSSAALECAVAVALDGLFDLGLGADDAGRTQLADACIRAENEIAGAATGGMDQSSSLRAQAGHALLLDCLDGSVRHIPFDLATDGLALLVVDTRAEHQLADGQYAARRTTCDAAAAQLELGTLREIDPGTLEATLARLAPDDAGTQDIETQDVETMRRRVRHVVTEIARVRELVGLLDAGRAREIGPILDASHASLRDDYEVSCLELDLAVEAARAAGALGARMTGGGFGGSAIALVERARVDAVAAAVAAAFAAQGLTPPAFLVAAASAPAARTA
ncbi:galactokinase [Pengzhenrongella sicca]|uniref:Galactokinase n=1 Tax=Pengzhenrongella sicca TaxID=2819238 RepID=A0A8A4ZFB8_9MICO|nr:galactokinase [Pengzhenrongella sicca]QTE29995.1 galactokinase [Pengzhenrongella sicca]